MQIDTRPSPAKKLIDASLPKNISAADKAKLEAEWNENARKRAESIAKETRIPTESSVTLRYHLRKFGKHWNAFSANEKGKMAPLLHAPSLLSSAIDALTDKMSEEAVRM